MIVAGLILGTKIAAGSLIAAGVAAVVAHFWEDIVEWMQETIEMVKRKIKGVLVGSKVYIKKLGDKVEEIARHYSKNEKDQWEETTVTKRVSPDEVPEEFLQQAEQNNDELDITDELEMQLAT